jgi:predicted TIM-barrel fold metal-dependent hydrolase
MGRVDAKLGPDQPAVAALLELAKLDSCWIKVSGAERISPPPFSAAVPVAARILAAIPDKVLWGTDFPHPNLKVEVDEADLVDLVPAYAVTEDAQRCLLVDNPARLYGF